MDTELRPVIAIRDSNATLALFNSKSKDLPINSTIYFDKDGRETRFTEAKTLLNSGQVQFSAFTRLSETSFKLELSTKSRRRLGEFKCFTEGDDMDNTKDFVSADDSDGFVDGEGSELYISAALKQTLTLPCQIKKHPKNGISWFMVGGAAIFSMVNLELNFF